MAWTQKKINRDPPLRLKTRGQAVKYLRNHLKPVKQGPKGQPIYDLKEVQSLNVIFPEDC